MNDRLWAHFSAVRDAFVRVLFAGEQLVSAQIQLHCAEACRYLSSATEYGFIRTNRPRFFACSAYSTYVPAQVPQHFTCPGQS